MFCCFNQLVSKFYSQFVGGMQGGPNSKCLKVKELAASKRLKRSIREWRLLYIVLMLAA